MDGGGRGYTTDNTGSWGSYDPKHHVPLARRLALLGYHDKWISNIFGIGLKTLQTWLADHPLLRQALVNGRDLADSRVAEALYKRAIGFTSPDGTYYPPNVRACVYWLNNRQGTKWRSIVHAEFTAKYNGGDKVIEGTIVAAPVEAMEAYREMLAAGEIHDPDGEQPGGEQPVVNNLANPVKTALNNPRQGHNRAGASYAAMRSVGSPHCFYWVYFTPSRTSPAWGYTWGARAHIYTPVELVHRLVHPLNSTTCSTVPRGKCSGCHAAGAYPGARTRRCAGLDRV